MQRVIKYWNAECTQGKPLHRYRQIKANCEVWVCEMWQWLNKPEAVATMLLNLIYAFIKKAPRYFNFKSEQDREAQGLEWLRCEICTDMNISQGMTAQLENLVWFQFFEIRSLLVSLRDISVAIQTNTSKWSSDPTGNVNNLYFTKHVGLNVCLNADGCLLGSALIR